MLDVKSTLESFIKHNKEELDHLAANDLWEEIYKLLGEAFPDFDQEEVQTIFNEIYSMEEDNKEDMEHKNVSNVPTMPFSSWMKSAMGVNQKLTETERHIKRREDISNEINENMDSGWGKITIDDLKQDFPYLQDGGEVDNSYKKSPSVIIPDVNTAVEILTYLKNKMGFFGIGGEPKDIKEIWDRFPNATVKMALPLFLERRYEQIIPFVFDDGSRYPAVLTYHSNRIDSPYIWKRISNASWEEWGYNKWDDYFKKFSKENEGYQISESKRVSSYIKRRREF
jgi:hypothetical protein